MNGQTSLISVGALFSESWKLYKEKFGALTKVMLLPIAFLFAGDFLLLYEVGFGEFLAFIGSLISFLAFLALIFVLDKNASFDEAYKLTLRRVFSYILLAILSFFITLGGYFALVIPGIIISAWLAFGMYVFALEKEKGMNALLRSRQYVQGQWWSVFGRYLLFVGAVFIAFFVLGFTASFFLDQEVINLTVDILGLFVAPLGAVYFYVLYRNLVALKPELIGQSPAGPKGWFIASAIWGVIGLILLILAFVTFVGLANLSNDSQGGGAPLPEGFTLPEGYDVPEEY